MPHASCPYCSRGFAGDRCPCGSRRVTAQDPADELSRAMGFPDGYQFHGTREEKVRQIGNAVCVNLSKALVRAALEGRR